MATATNSFSAAPPISATVVVVAEKYLRLTSRKFGDGNYLEFSAAFALSAMRRTYTRIPRLWDIFRVGDEFILEDVDFDSGNFDSVKIRAVQGHRNEGTYVIGDGLLIEVVEKKGFVVRSAFFPEFICPMEKCDNQERIEHAKVGDVVTFQVLVSRHRAQIQVSMFKINAPGARAIPFPVYHTAGTVHRNPSNGNIGIYCSMGDNATKELIPLYDGAYFGCGIAAHALVGETVDCVLCHSQPRFPSSDLQVIYFKPRMDAQEPDCQLEEFRLQPVSPNFHASEVLEPEIEKDLIIL